MYALTIPGPGSGSYLWCQTSPSFLGRFRGVGGYRPNQAQLRTVYGVRGIGQDQTGMTVDWLTLALGAGVLFLVGRESSRW